MRGESAVPGDCYSAKISRSEPRLEAEEKATLKVMCWGEARLGLKDRVIRVLNRKTLGWREFLLVLGIGGIHFPCFLSWRALGLGEPGGKERRGGFEK